MDDDAIRCTAAPKQSLLDRWPKLSGAIAAALVAVIGAGGAYVTGWITVHTPHDEPACICADTPTDPESL